MFQLLFQNLAMLFVWSNNWHISNDWSNIYRENYHLVGGGPDVDLLSTKCQKSITNLHNDPNFDVGTSACENLSNIFFRNVEVHSRQIRVRLQTVKNNCNDKTTRLLSVLEKQWWNKLTLYLKTFYQPNFPTVFHFVCFVQVFPVQNQSRRQEEIAHKIPWTRVINITR